MTLFLQNPLKTYITDRIKYTYNRCKCLRTQNFQKSHYRVTKWPIGLVKTNTFQGKPVSSAPATETLKSDRHMDRQKDIRWRSYPWYIGPTSVLCIERCDMFYMLFKAHRIHYKALVKQKQHSDITDNDDDTKVP